MRITTIIAVFCMLGLIGCATQAPPDPQIVDAPGFPRGLFDGVVFIFSFIGSIFYDVRIYAVPNSGLFYDFGYVTGATFFGVITLK